MIHVRNLTKRFGNTVAVDDLSFDVQPGRVTGFLGPNGSGKSTTMRCMVGLDRFESGDTTFDGKRFTELSNPLREVGILLDAGYVHPARTGRNHLRWLAASNGLPLSRVDEALEQVGMSDVGGRKVRGYSLGMKQRLGLASVILGDPAMMILDEPANGLDPEGIRWIRDFLRYYADQGRSVLVSSHLLSEMSLMAEDLIVIGKGQLIQQSSVEDFVARHAQTWVRVRSPQLPSLIEAVQAAGATVSLLGEPTALEGADVRGLTIEQVGDAAAHSGVTLHELSNQAESLEDAFLTATADSQEYKTGGVA